MGATSESVHCSVHISLILLMTDSHSEALLDTLRMKLAISFLKSHKITTTGLQLEVGRTKITQSDTKKQKGKKSTEKK